MHVLRHFTTTADAPEEQLQFCIDDFFFARADLTNLNFNDGDSPATPPVVRFCKLFRVLHAIWASSLPYKIPYDMALTGADHRTATCVADHLVVLFAPYLASSIPCRLEPSDPPLEQARRVHVT